MRSTARAHAWLPVRSSSTTQSSAWGHRRPPGDPPRKLPPAAATQLDRQLTVVEMLEKQHVPQRLGAIRELSAVPPRALELAEAAAPSQRALDHHLSQVRSDAGITRANLPQQPHDAHVERGRGEHLLAILGRHHLITPVSAVCSATALPAFMPTLTNERKRELWSHSAPHAIGVGVLCCRSGCSSHAR